MISAMPRTVQVWPLKRIRSPVDHWPATYRTTNLASAKVKRLASALTPAEGQRLSSKRLWDAAQQASATQGTDRAFGVKRTRLTQIANDMFPMPPLKNQRDTVTGKPAMCWEGWDVSTATDTDVCQHGQPLAPPCPDCQHAAAASAAAHRPEQGGLLLPSTPTCFEGCGAAVEAPGKTCPPAWLMSCSPRRGTSNARYVLARIHRRRASG